MTEQRNTAPTSGAIRNSRIKLVAILALFIGPLVVAFIWYYGLEAKFAPTGQVNNSPLIEPVITLGDFDNTVHGDGAISRDDLAQKWTLIHTVGKDCDETCTQFLYHSRQTRIALGKDTDRLQRYIIVSDAGLVEEIGREHPDATLLEPDGDGILGQLVPAYESEGALMSDAILVDPLGNAMMRIPADIEPKLLLKDLKKLFKLSRIG